jgi:hypothetical protein
MANYPTSVPSFTTKSAGQTIGSAHMNGVQDEIVAIGTDLLTWTSYSPTWGNTGTANVLGDGSVLGKWARHGKTIHVSIAFVWGSTTVAGNGAFTFTLPVTAAGLLGTIDAAGGGTLTDASVGQYGAIVALLTTLTVFVIPTNVVSNGISATVPFTWTAPDGASFAFRYQAA